MARTDTLGNFLTDVAEAIRTKKGTTETIPANTFDTEIASIEGGGKYAPRYLSFYRYAGTELDEEIANLDTSNITTMANLFNACTNLTSLDLSSLNTSNVTDMNNMFNNCSKLISLNLSNFDTTNVKSMGFMFFGCSKLTTLDLNNFNTSNVTDIGSMFYSCSGLTTLDLSNFDISKLVGLTSTFQGCSSLTTLDLSNFNTENISNFQSAFQNCSKLTSIPELNAGKVIKVSSTFYNCTALENFGGLKNLGESYSTSSSANYMYYTLELSTCTSLTHDSLMNVINNLYDIATKGCNTQKLTLGTTNLAKLTEEEIAIATNKGWTVS